MLIRKIITISILLLLHAVVNGQGNASEVSPSELAKQHIVEMKEGYLTVVLESHLRKLNELYALSQNDAISEKQRNRVLREYNELIARRDQFNHALIQAFDAHFNFCTYQLIYDYQLRIAKPVINHARAEPFTYKQMDGTEYRLRLGKTREAEQFGIQALVLTNDEGQDLSDPFPYYVRLNKRTWLEGLISIFNPDGYKRKDPEELVKQLNYQLWEFYNEVQVQTRQ